jgi:hypothetical protein
MNGPNIDPTTNIIHTNNMKKFTNEIVYQNDWYREGDYVSINSVRLNDMFYADGSVSYIKAGVTK